MASILSDPDSPDVPRLEMEIDELVNPVRGCVVFIRSGSIPQKRDVGLVSTLGRKQKQDMITY